jgi:RHS repeat-associated protein
VKNLIAWNGNTYQYDAFNQMARMKSGSEDWVYINTAGDERFWFYRVGGGGSLWALRDLDGKILREYEAHTSWSSFKDYIYRGSQLLASSHPTEGVRHLHLDHLGTPRLVTSGSTGGDFFTLTPCRALDTRDQSAPLTAGETRTVTLVGVCSIPSSATAVSLNITAVDSTAQGEMTAWPANEPQPVTSAISYQASLNRANNGILKLGNGALSFFANQLSGTVHLVIDVNGYFTEPAGAVVAYHVYYPFGEEATAFNEDTEQMKFTGHERDLASLAGAGDDLDYMHARHASPLTGRFLSLDPTLESVSLFEPQSWNCYSYVQCNPLLYVDPTGALLVFAGSKSNLERLQAFVSDALQGYELKINKNGTAVLVANNTQGPPTPEQAVLASALSDAINRNEVIRIGVESGASDVLVGNYASGKIDIQDIDSIGEGLAVSASSAFAHEVAEQTAKQVRHLLDSKEHIALAHRFGTVAQNQVSGYTRGRTNDDLFDYHTMSGYTTLTEQSRGGQTTLVIFQWSNGNLVKVIRR